MKKLKTSIDYMLKSIIQKRPKLLELINDQPVIEYLRPAIEWKQDKNIFPYAHLLSDIIGESIARLYGDDTAEEARKQLENSWVIETGAHLHIPRRYNNLVQKEGAQINSLLFQGQVLWALANQKLGRKLAISLNSGRVPLDNTNSGAYLDLPALKNPITLASKKKHPDSPQSLIPARTKEEIESKIELLNMYKKQRMLPEEQFELGHKILMNFLNVQTSFSDQVATSHALMLNIVLPIKQVTIDSELIGNDFILALLKNKNSLLYSIFNDPQRREKFMIYLGNIDTGWSQGESPFYYVLRKDEGFRLANYSGDLSPQTIIKGLEEKTLWPTGVMKFFAMMVEAGILPVGGWTQAVYCSDIKTQSVKLLKSLGYTERAEMLKKMPTSISAVAPCWGIDEVDGKFQLLDAITTILNPSSVNFSYITNLTGTQTLLIAAPTLYEFLLREPPMINYDELQGLSASAFVKN